MIAPPRLIRPISNRFRKKRINRVPSPVIALGLPWISIMLGSLSPTWPVIASAPVLPPLGLLMLLAWRQMRPGLMPVWAGLPLGAFDDVFSGQPFGSAILLWSLAIIVLELIEARFPWRNLLLDWLISTMLVWACLLLMLAFANAGGGDAPVRVLVPQGLTAILLYPLACRFVSLLDRVRLMPLLDAR